MVLSIFTLHSTFTLLRVPYLEYWCIEYGVLESVTVLRHLRSCRGDIIIIIIIYVCLSIGSFVTGFFIMQFGVRRVGASRIVSDTLV